MSSSTSTSDKVSGSADPPGPGNADQVVSPTSILDQLLNSQTKSPPTPNATSSFSHTTGRPASADVYSPITDIRNAASSASRTPSLFTHPPKLRDSPPSATSIKQAEIMRMIMKSNHVTPLPELDRTTHTQYLLEPLIYGLSERYVTLDASRPWMLYWCLNAVSILAGRVENFNDPLIDNLQSLQSPLGGFGGGNGQWPHLAATYAGILALTICTHAESLTLPSSEHPALYSNAFSWINRPQLLNWCKSLRCPNGGFRVNGEGEEDVRAAYCVLVICAIMSFDEDELKCEDTGKGLFDGVKDYFQRCQSWDGGLGAKEDCEAHGGYAFCVLAGLCLLGEPGEVLNTHLDVPNLISWLSARQYAPEGGLSGRTNKLVDGCYSAWVGGCWSLVEAAVNERMAKETGNDGAVVGSLWNRKALIRYIMTCCQDERGGLKDKPNMRPDHYHTNYVLLGLSAAQHYFYYDHKAPSKQVEGEPKIPFESAFNWKGRKNIPLPSTEEGYGGGWEKLGVEDDDRVEMQHPVFNIPLGAEQGVWNWWKWWRANGRPNEVLIEVKEDDLL